ncbi:MAG: DEAD/DEAH box helicase family protein [Gammaproteobacteria bacterium]|nr:DEAD/DEAH box helicase family protein [Gammaproteobacteria bacterium]
MQNEAKSRIKINKLLETAGWRLLDGAQGRANVLLENRATLTRAGLDALGEDFEKVRAGYIDFLLVDDNGFPLAVLEAKAENINPLAGKEQARRYARSQHCRFVILSNGNLHYFWDLEQGSPEVITRFPDSDSLGQRRQYRPDPAKLAAESVAADYIALSQMPDYARNPGWLDEKQRAAFERREGLRFLRDYQLRAVHALQQSAGRGNNRFLFEMATGTGKTLTTAALIKLFLRTGNARRVLFLVDRLELETQAHKEFTHLLKNDCECVIYKETRDDWRKAEIVVSTVQSLLFDNKYQRLFGPSDFDFIISDEAHRSISGNARALFEYFLGYKLGLTATPKDYLKNLQQNPADIREMERRLLLDTYRTFGCESGEPTFRYALVDGVRDGYLVKTHVVDVRSRISQELLSDAGHTVQVAGEDGGLEEQVYVSRDFERKFLSEPTNRVFCEAFLKHAERDPVSGEIGKTIVFTVSQNHAAKITHILNELADAMFPGKYRSDFAVQVTSLVQDAQQFSRNFANNNLNGSANFLEFYKTGKTRVCVTVGMMTTGYDCTDILNLCLMRPIASPTDFVQMKGRGTRRHDFLQQVTDNEHKEAVGNAQKERFKLFDFFANYRYFEEEYDYEEVIELPPTGEGDGQDRGRKTVAKYESTAPDELRVQTETLIGREGMKIDRRMFERFEKTVRADEVIRRRADAGQWDIAVKHLKEEILNKPEDYFDLDKLRRAAGADRRLSPRELLEKALGLISRFKSKDELLDDEFNKFIADRKPDSPETIVPMKYYFQAYITDSEVRKIVESKDFSQLHANSALPFDDYQKVPEQWRAAIPEYIRDYVALDRFME